MGQNQRVVDGDMPARFAVERVAKQADAPTIDRKPEIVHSRSEKMRRSQNGCHAEFGRHSGEHAEQVDARSRLEVLGFQRSRVVVYRPWRFLGCSPELADLAQLRDLWIERDVGAGRPQRSDELWNLALDALTIIARAGRRPSAWRSSSLRKAVSPVRMA